MPILYPIGNMEDLGKIGVQLKHNWTKFWPPWNSIIGNTKSIIASFLFQDIVRGGANYSLGGQCPPNPVNWQNINHHKRSPQKAAQSFTRSRSRLKKNTSSIQVQVGKGTATFHWESFYWLAWCAVPLAETYAIFCLTLPKYHKLLFTSHSQTSMLANH